MNELSHALVAYFLAIFSDGDSGNDWIMHLPVVLRSAITNAGDVLSAALTLIGWV